MALHTRSPIVILCEHLQKTSDEGDRNAIALLERGEIQAQHITRNRSAWYWAARYPRIAVIEWLFENETPGMNTKSQALRSGELVSADTPLDRAFSQGASDNYRVFCFLMSKNAISHDETTHRKHYERTFFHVATLEEKDAYRRYSHMPYSPDPGCDSSVAATPSPGPYPDF